MNIRILSTLLPTLLLGGATAFAAAAGPGAQPAASQQKGQQIDANGDGAISMEEVAAMQADRFKKLDLDGNGEVTADELTEHTLTVQRKRIARMAEMQVNRLDSNKDGVVSEEEFTASAEEGFARRDANDDGELTREEMRGGQARNQPRQGRQGGPRNGEDG